MKRNLMGRGQGDGSLHVLFEEQEADPGVGGARNGREVHGELEAEAEAGSWYLDFNVSFW